jgi:hypothetical protein
MMKCKCQHVSASEAGDEIFQVRFEAQRDQEGGPYVLIQRAWLDEDDDEFSPIYVETHEERLIGHYPTVKAELSRNRLTLRLPPPVAETIEVEFVASEKEFRELSRMLGIILQKDLAKEEKRNANQAVHAIGADAPQHDG